MCGIFGWLGERAQNENSQAARLVALKALEHLKHRGPDANGVETLPLGVFAHTRLAIIDLDSGRQPMISEDHRFTITFNGEIYNFVELRNQLAAAGYPFRTHSDTEVLLAGYIYWGRSIVDKLNGMFAFAIFDAREKSVFAARDPYGQKPLFFAGDAANFAFASELSALREVPVFTDELDRTSLIHFLRYEAFYGARTTHRNFHKLLPGHLLEWRMGQAPQTHRYFMNEPANTRQIAPLEEEELDQLLTDSVRIACRADVPVAVLLSGGLDSALVLALMRRCFPDQPITAFHLRNTSASFDEYHYAKKVADHLQVELRSFDFTGDDLAATAATLPGRLDQPQADPGLLPKHFLCRRIADDFKVALTGDGGDEFFHGYLIFKGEKVAQIYQHTPHWLHRYLVQPAGRALPAGFGYMGLDFLSKQFLKGFPGERELRSLKWMQALSREDLASALDLSAGEIENSDDGEDLIRQAYVAAADADPLNQLAFRLQRTYLPDYVLANSDRSSMLNSLELRAPLLDVPLARRMSQVGDRQKMPGWTTKELLKKYALRYLPRDVVYRKKMGFTAPVAEIIRGQLRESFLETLSSAELKRSGIFKVDFVQRMLSRHLSGQENLYKPLWTIYSLQQWLSTNRTPR